MHYANEGKDVFTKIELLKWESTALFAKHHIILNIAEIGSMKRFLSNLFHEIQKKWQFPLKVSLKKLRVFFLSCDKKAVLYLDVLGPNLGRKVRFARIWRGGGGILCLKKEEKSILMFKTFFKGECLEMYHIQHKKISKELMFDFLFSFKLF